LPDTPPARNHINNLARFRTPQVSKIGQAEMGADVARSAKPVRPVDRGSHKHAGLQLMIAPDMQQLAAPQGFADALQLRAGAKFGVSQITSATFRWNPRLSSSTTNGAV
jgi:hypothetical protein